MRKFRTRVLALTALAILLFPWLGFNGGVSLAQHRLGSGIIVPLRMDSSLSSRSVQIGETWRATVTQDVYDNGVLVIPSGSKAEGNVTTVEPAGYNRSGRIAIDFNRIIFPDGQVVGN